SRQTRSRGKPGDSRPGVSALPTAEVKLMLSLSLLLSSVLCAPGDGPAARPEAGKVPGAKAAGEAAPDDEKAAADKAIARRDYPRARTHLEKYLKVRPDSAAVHLLAARTARRAGAYDQAERHLKECERLKGQADAVKLERTLLAFQRGRWKESEP